jgi:hypothetical protein
MRLFDLAQGPLWRGSLLPLGEGDHGVLLTQLGCLPELASA